ncbi:MAG: hypothetical protein E7404_09300 [Ruminococcaceae bacterium]|nr:hypothetical protein [Oscillospiraceae bacterium]
MKNNSPKHIALKTLIKHKHYLLNNYTDLRRIIESNQFTIIEYKKHANSEPVSELIKRLRIENETRQKDSFIYINNNLKFVFINADIPDEDKCSLLRHELGHICDPDLKNSNPQNSSIEREEFANEFSCYTKNPGISFKLYVLIMKKWKLLVSVLMLIVSILGLSFWINSLIIKPTKSVTTAASVYENFDNIFYVTTSGKKYHRKSCFIVKYKTNVTQYTLDEAVDAGYAPCMICNLE